MLYFLEQLIAMIWNRLRGQGGETRERERGTLTLGFRVEDGQVIGRRLALSSVRRTTHLAVLGKTGSGKSFFLRNLSAQDIAARRGFVYFDLHGDATPFLLGTIAAYEQRGGQDLSERVIVIDPADPLASVGFNAFEPVSQRINKLPEQRSGKRCGNDADRAFRSSARSQTARRFASPSLAGLGWQLLCDEVPE